jgi:hypothetical protein
MRPLGDDCAGLHPTRCALARSGDDPASGAAEYLPMPHPAHAHLPAGLRTGDAQRIASGCWHALVPAQPASRGYRYIDLGGSEPPFYLLRFGSGDACASVSLCAPIELSSAGDAEPGAAAVAQIKVTVGLNTLRWERLLDVDLCSGVWADLLGQALTEIAALDLLERSSCPVCGPVS